MERITKYTLNDTPQKVVIGDKRAHLEVTKGSQVAFTLSQELPDKSIYFNLFSTLNVPSGVVIWAWTRDGKEAVLSVGEFDVTGGGGGGGGGDIYLEDAFGTPLNGVTL